MDVWAAAAPAATIPPAAASDHGQPERGCQAARLQGAGHRAEEWCKDQGRDRCADGEDKA